MFAFSFSGPDIDEPSRASSSPSTLDQLTDALSLSSSTATSQAAENGSLRTRQLVQDRKDVNSAFPVAGQNLLPPLRHGVEALIEQLPGRIAYSTLQVVLDDGTAIKLPRRDLWDVRGQVAAFSQEDGDAEGAAWGLGLGPGLGLGREDVKTGVYEGGFKSWESSEDLVKELGSLTSGWRVGGEGNSGAEQGREDESQNRSKKRRRIKRNSMGKKAVIELGCGTALPSLAVLQWFLRRPRVGSEEQRRPPQPDLHLMLADYNPSVLSLVTFPNVLLTWWYCCRCAAGESWEDEGEMDVTEERVRSFQHDLAIRGVRLGFVSGAWSDEFVHLLSSELALGSKDTRLMKISSSSEGVEGKGLGDGEGETLVIVADPDEEETEPEMEDELLILGAETIYSPTALIAFAETVMGLLTAKTTESEVGKKGQSNDAKFHGNGSAGTSIQCEKRSALVAAKKVYFGVGGSMKDFIDKIYELGRAQQQYQDRGRDRGQSRDDCEWEVVRLREAIEGVRREVVQIRKVALSRGNDANEVGP